MGEEGSRKQEAQAAKALLHACWLGDRLAIANCDRNQPLFHDLNRQVRIHYHDKPIAPIKHWLVIEYLNLANCKDDMSDTKDV